MMNAGYVRVVVPGLVATVAAFILLVTPAGPLWLSLGILGFGLALVTTATAREAMQVPAEPVRREPDPATRLRRIRPRRTRQP